MKRLLLSIAIVIAIYSGANAQIKLIGTSINTETGKIDLLEWDALDSASVTVTPTILDAYFFATSGFDAYNSKYYLTGISGDSSGLYSYNALTNEEDLVPGSSFTNIAEFDMSNGKLYNLIMETEEYINVYAFDISTNSDSLIGTIYEPGTIGIVADAIGFDSNNGILYYAGYTNDPALCLYAIPVRDSVFSFTKTILNPVAPYNSITSVNYDNVNDKIYALNDTYDSLFMPTGRYIVEIDKVTGDITNRCSLLAYPYYIGGSSCFDQTTGTFMVGGIDSSFNIKMLAFNTMTDSLVAGFIPDLVSEIVCDNSIFAKYAYTSTAISGIPTLQATIYPNPVSEMLTITHSATTPVDIYIYAQDGKLVASRNAVGSSQIEINVKDFAPGIYMVSLSAGDTNTIQKIVVQ